MTEIDGKNLTLEQLMSVLDTFYNHAGAQNTQLSKFALVFFTHRHLISRHHFFPNTSLPIPPAQQNT